MGGGGRGGGRRKEWRGVEGRDRSLTCNELPTSNILLARDIRISSGSMGRAVNKFESWGRIRNTGPTCYLGCHVVLTDTHKARNWELLTSIVPGDHPQLCTKPLRKFWIYSWLIHLNLAVTGKLKWDDFLTNTYSKIKRKKLAKNGRLDSSFGRLPSSSWVCTT